MNTIDTIKEQERRLKELEEALHIQKEKKEKKFKFRIPIKFQRATKKNTQTAAAICIGHNRRIQWKKAVERDGLWHIGEQKYAYEESSVFFIKNTPVIIIFEWRMIPVGGIAEEYKSRIIGGQEDQDNAALIGIKNFGEQTIIRAIEQAELDKDEKKKGGMGWIIWILLGVGAIYLLSRFFGG